MRISFGPKDSAERPYSLLAFRGSETLTPFFSGWVVLPLNPRRSVATCVLQVGKLSDNVLNASKKGLPGRASHNKREAQSFSSEGTFQNGREKTLPPHHHRSKIPTIETSSAIIRF